MNLATNLYDADFYGWTQRQADTLRARDVSAIDFDNLIEEIESMGRSEKRELESRFEVLLMHLLKWHYQPGFRGTSWQVTIKEQRSRIADHLKDNPSLKGVLTEIFDRAYRYAVMEAVKETGMGESVFPSECPWTYQQVMDANYWPEAAN